MALTNEQKAKIVTAGGLAHYHEKSGALFATKTAVSGKADKVSSATNNNLAGLNSNGNLKDSGIAAADVMTKTINTTWSALKALRDGSQLTPGQWYRITDYTCTTTQTDTQSAGHVFDIIVRADDVNVLNENAYAAHHAGDTYFANSKLEAWKLLYCLDNDTDRFGWVGIDGSAIVNYNGQNYTVEYTGVKTINGKEYYVLTSYDLVQYFFTGNFYADGKAEGADIYAYYPPWQGSPFSKTSIKLVSLTEPSEGESKGVIYYMKDEYGNECPYDFKNIMFARYQITAMTKVPELVNTYSGFKDISTSSSKKYPSDATISNTAVYRYTFDYLNGTTSNDLTVYQQSQTKVVCHGNIIASWFIDNQKKRSLNNIVIGGNSFQSCYGNEFGENCRNNSFGYSMFGNSFGTNVYYNTIGNDFRNNTTGNSFQNNTIGNSFFTNTIGELFANNSIGNYFQGNTIGNYFQGNTIGNSFDGNSIGHTFGGNTIGNNAYSNSIGNDCNHINIQKDYVYFIIIENRNQYINITSTQTTSSSQKLCNFTMAQGVNNTTTTKTISHNTVNDTFQTVYKPANSVEVSV